MVGAKVRNAVCPSILADCLGRGGIGKGEGGGVPYAGRLPYYQRMTNDHEIVIHASWDVEASVWVAESDDVPGLATEAPTLDELDAKLAVMIPELLELNDGDLPEVIPFYLMARRETVSALR